VEAVALIVQIHLEQNRTDLAIKEVAAARRWAQDSLLVNLAESWVGLRVVCSVFPGAGLKLTVQRAERSTNKPSMFSKNWPKLPQPRQYRA
jgi:Coatomer epsilon subunit